MKLDTDICYQALLTHDARFDGAFFVGVKTTGIYCRTICPAKRPKVQNCRFFPSAAAAELAGFRPCLRCRPELAPGNASTDAVHRLASVISSKIEEGVLAQLSVAELAQSLGITERHLRRVVDGAFGASPIEIAQTQRLLLAKQLLTDSNLSISEIAFAAGFSSLRRFNALFKDRYALSPSKLRRGRSTEKTNAWQCELSYRPPFDWQSLLAFLQQRAIGGVEKIYDDKYVRTVALGKERGWFSIQPAKNKNTLIVQMSPTLIKSLLPVLTRIKKLFDLNADPETISKRLGKIAKQYVGLRLPGAFDGFEITLRAIVGQQVSVKAATTLMTRFVQTFGDAIETPFPELTHTFPSPAKIAVLSVKQVAKVGITPKRAQAIIYIAKLVADKKLNFDFVVHPEQVIAQLQELPGIGAWTAHYIAMRALNYPDAFPHTDLGIRKALSETNSKRILAMAEKWRPWRSYAAMHLWKSLEVKA